MAYRHRCVLLQCLMLFMEFPALCILSNLQLFIEKLTASKIN
jgi:hypothetical protein